MINSLFRSLLMQGAGEEPVPGRWEYADYIHPATSAPNGIVLQSYKLSNTSNNLTIDFKIPTSITQSDSICIVHQGSFIIKAYYDSSKLTLWVQCSDLTTFTVSQYGTDDGTQVHRVTLKNGYVWLDKQLFNNTQAVKTSLNGKPKIAENFTSDCAIYNIYYYLNTETHSQVLFSKTHGFECPYSYFGSTVMNTINTVQAADRWVGNFDYEPEYVDYIKPNTVDGLKLLNLPIVAYPKVKLSCEVSQEYTSTIYTAGYWIDYDDYYERGYNQLQGGLGSAVVYQQSPTQYTFSSVATGTKFTFDNFSGTPKMNGATGVSSNIGYDRTWTEDDEGVIKAVHTIWAGTKVYSFKISANGINTYDCLPVLPHYNVAWASLPGSTSYIDGYLMDKNTGFRFMPVADVSDPSMQLVSYFKPSIFEQKYIAAKNNAASIPTDIYTNSSTLLTRAQFNLGAVSTQDSRYYHNLLTMANYASPGGLACIGFKRSAKNYFMFYVNGSGKDEWTTVTQNTWNTISTSSYSNYCYSDAIPITFFGSNYGSQANNQSCLYNYINEAKLTIGGVVYDCKFGVLGDVVGVMINDVFYPANDSSYFIVQ